MHSTSKESLAPTHFPAFNAGKLRQKVAIVVDLALGTPRSKGQRTLLRLPAGSCLFRRTPECFTGTYEGGYAAFRRH
jgi:hypothetical protein